MNKFTFKECTQEDIVNFCKKHDIYIGLLNKFDLQVSRVFDIDHIQIQIYNSIFNESEYIFLTVYIKEYVKLLQNVLDDIEVVYDYYLDVIPESIRHLIEFVIY